MTDERLCGVCGHEEGAHVGDDPNGQVCSECHGNEEYELMLHPFELSTPPPPEAAPSTDEGEVRWERMEESPDYVVWRKRWSEGYSESTAIPRAVEAVIRAPLEERIRELQAVEFHTDGIMHIATERIETLEAENERLREALDKVMFAWQSHSGGDDFVNLVGYHIPEIERALATPPSSTAGTKEVEG